jgi:hypothetical protein
MKLFLPVSGFQDCLKIQSNLNVGKCKNITFARSRAPVEFPYMLGGTVLDRVSSKRSRSHHGRENDFYGACGSEGLCDARIYQETFVGV